MMTLKAFYIEKLMEVATMEFALCD